MLHTITVVIIQLAIIIKFSTQQIVTLFDERYSEEEGYHSRNSGSKEITSNEQFQVCPINNPGFDRFTSFFHVFSGVLDIYIT